MRAEPSAVATWNAERIALMAVETSRRLQTAAVCLECWGWTM